MERIGNELEHYEFVSSSESSGEEDVKNLNYE